MKINIGNSNVMGHKRILGMHSDLVSKDSPIKNDISRGTTIGSNSEVKRDVNSNSSQGSDIGTNIKGLVVRRGRGWFNKPG
jgi:hypothetical protein